MGFQHQNRLYLTARSPDIVLINHKNQEHFIIDAAIPGDFCVRIKRQKKYINTKILLWRYLESGIQN